MSDVRKWQNAYVCVIFGEQVVMPNDAKQHINGYLWMKTKMFGYRQ